MTRFVIFGVLGPAASYLSFCFLMGWPARWADLPLAYGIEVVPFLLCALIDRFLENVRSWERVIVVGIAGFFTSAVAMPVAASVLFPRGARNYDPWIVRDNSSRCVLSTDDSYEGS